MKVEYLLSLFHISNKWRSIKMELRIINSTKAHSEGDFSLFAQAFGTYDKNIRKVKDASFVTHIHVAHIAEMMIRLPFNCHLLFLNLKMCTLYLMCKCEVYL